MEGSSLQGLVIHHSTASHNNSHSLQGWGPWPLDLLLLQVTQPHDYSATTVNWSHTDWSWESESDTGCGLGNTMHKILQEQRGGLQNTKNCRVQSKEYFRVQYKLSLIDNICCIMLITKKWTHPSRKRIVSKFIRLKSC